jgi:pyruvate dehydrogenase E1 component beta subunit
MAFITMRQAISDALREEMKRDETVFIMGEEVGVWGGTYAVTRGFYDEFGEKPRTRHAHFGDGHRRRGRTGAAMGGLRPVAEFMTINFAFLALDAMVNHAAKSALHVRRADESVPVVYRAPGGGGRQLGATHSHTPDVIFAHFPGLKVVSPATPYDAKGLLKAAIRYRRPGAVTSSTTRSIRLRGEVPAEDYVVPIGVSDVKRPKAMTVTIVAYAQGLQVALQAAKQLAQRRCRAPKWSICGQPAAARHGARRRVVPQDVQGRRRRRGVSLLRHRRRESPRGSRKKHSTTWTHPSSAWPSWKCPCRIRANSNKSALINAGRVVAAVKEIL